MRLVDNPLHLPGVCIVCKGGTRRQCVDTLQKIGNWRVYVCKQCAAEIVHLFGFVKSEDLHMALEEIEDMRGALDAAQRAIAELTGSRMNVVPVDEVVPYLKKLPGRPRKADGPVQEADTAA